MGYGLTTILILNKRDIDKKIGFGSLSTKFDDNDNLVENNFRI